MKNSCCAARWSGEGAGAIGGWCCNRGRERDGNSAPTARNDLKDKTQCVRVCECNVVWGQANTHTNARVQCQCLCVFINVNGRTNKLQEQKQRTLSDTKKKKNTELKLFL